MPVLTHAERVGTLLAGKYQLEAILGQGGMGAVFAATHRWTGRPVAVKLLNPEFAARADVAERFLREARAAAALKHPNVVDVLDMDRADDGAVFMVLERLEGKSLADVLRARGRLAPPEANALLTPVMRALAWSHARGVVHRDLKPDNLFVSRDATGAVVPKLLDFGIAKVRGGRSEGMAGATRTGMMIGTLAYMAPEQVHGDSSLDARADVWAMGVVWYECLAGRLPFDAPTETAIALAIVQGQHIPLNVAAPDVAGELADAIERSLRVDRATRYADMDSFADAIDRCLAGGPIAQPTSSARSGPGSPSAALDPAASRPRRPNLPPVPGGAGADGASHPAPSGTLAGTSVPPRPRRAHSGTNVARIALGAFGLCACAAVGLGVAKLVASGRRATGVTSAQPSPRESPPSSSHGPTSIADAPRALVRQRPATTDAGAWASPPSTPPSPVPSGDPGAQPLATNPRLLGFAQRWVQLVVEERAMQPLDDLYVDHPRFRGGGPNVSHSYIQTYWSGAFAHGSTFSVDLARSTWVEETPGSDPAIDRVCGDDAIENAEGPIYKLRLWAREYSPNRDPSVRCPTLEGVYLVRVRGVLDGIAGVGPTPRVCYESWSTREGLCASCPTARACQATTGPWRPEPHALAGRVGRDRARAGAASPRGGCP